MIPFQTQLLFVFLASLCLNNDIFPSLESTLIAIYAPA
ncbi:hypothetical protein CF65_00428 [Aggregatibacter actinomycetemcomitans HK1651]|nr:hypothetical protein CF65_00428 [Aggregatibacter actinomycetemcomitans HK1651]